MEPLPPINKVYSLISQEERQRPIHLFPDSSSSSNSDVLVVFAARGNQNRGKSSKKERPLCSHCGIHGHIVDKCFKLHGYPPRYKTRSKASSSSVNQVVTEIPPGMDAEKFQQALAMLAAHMARSSPLKVEAPEQSLEQGFTWIHLLQAKSEASQVLQNFISWVQTQFGVTINCLWSDNASKPKLTNFLAQRGIEHQFSCVECPQQNSVVECKHQHLLNVARALFF